MKYSAANSSQAASGSSVASSGTANPPSVVVVGRVDVDAGRRDQRADDGDPVLLGGAHERRRAVHVGRVRVRAFAEQAPDDRDVPLDRGERQRGPAVATDRVHVRAGGDNAG